jgi:hypothetical protein
MILSTSNVGLVGHLVVLLLAVSEWAFVLLFVYCLKRFRTNFPIKLTSAVFVILASFVTIIGQRQIYQPVSISRLSINEFDIVVIAEKTVSLFILFYGIRRRSSVCTVSPGENVDSEGKERPHPQKTRVGHPNLS